MLHHFYSNMYSDPVHEYFLQEEELRKGGEAKYAHLAMELHVFIEVTAPIPEAYVRMAHAMDEVKKFLIPVGIKHRVVY